MNDAVIWISAFGAWSFVSGVVLGVVVTHGWYRRNYDMAGWENVDTGESGTDWTSDPRKV